MSLAPQTDPRLTEPPTERDIRPVVALPRHGLPGAAIVGGVVIAGVALFAVLDADRRAGSALAVRPGAADTAFAAPPTLYVPPEPAIAAPPALYPAPSAARPAEQTPFRAYRSPSTAPSAPAAPVYTPAPPASLQTQPGPQRNTGGAALVVDTSQTEQASGRGGTTANGGPLAAPTSTERARAAMLANRSTTVPQGTLIPAVLETAFDSTRPGFARALVQRDVRGFDGTQVLIPRGSRLIGEYAADIQPGQSRAMVAWARLIRPDGVTIALASPSADPVGRGGIKADVNSHFLQRFSGAILQSTLDLGIALASRANSSATVVALPGSFQGTSSLIRPTEIRPTLKVRQGTSISVFVARDLDFTDVHAEP